MKKIYDIYNTNLLLMFLDVAAISNNCNYLITFFFKIVNFYTSFTPKSSKLIKFSISSKTAQIEKDFSFSRCLLNPTPPYSLFSLASQKKSPPWNFEIESELACLHPPLVDKVVFFSWLHVKITIWCKIFFPEGHMCHSYSVPLSPFPFSIDERSIKIFKADFIFLNGKLKLKKKCTFF